MHSDDQEKTDTNVPIVNDDHYIKVNPISTTVLHEGSEGSISWSAGEFVSHSKGPLWYILLAAVTIACAALVLLLLKDAMTAGVIIVVGIVLAIYGTKAPRELKYSVDSTGLQIGAKHYPFTQFRSFAIVRQGNFSSLAFFPIKRFDLLVAAYYDPQDESKIIDILSTYLPLDEKNPDFLDKLLWKIKF